jgi:diacylglycerol kinase (ATP)
MLAGGARSKSPLKALARLWPNTMCKFWGLHAGLWCAAAAVISWRTSSALMLPLVAANFALFGLLYRIQEDLGKSLATAGGLYFAAHAAMLWRAPEACAAQWLAALGVPLGVLRWARIWHAALAIGSFAFAIKAANKDRLFSEDGSMRGRSGGVAGTPPASALPTLAFVNRAAGAKLGERVAAALHTAAEQARTEGRVLEVVDLSQTPPEAALTAFAASHPAFRLLVCGGDGSASWVLEAIERAQLTGADGKPYRPAMALLPLGTGNDLARVLGWGKGVRFEGISAHLAALDSARVALLDRWTVRGSLPEGETERSLSNYMSIGVDARAALIWARMGKRFPWAFKLRLLNKLWYIVCGSPQFALHSYRRLSEEVTITCDGKPIELPKGIEGLMICNTPSYGGGSDLWDDFRAAPLPATTRHLQTQPALPASMSDGRLELVGVTDVVHLALALGGFSNGVRLCQGQQLQVSTKASGIPLQIDGEPFNLAAGSVNEPFDMSITRVGQSWMLGRGQEGGEGRASAFCAVESALGEQSISLEQRDALLRSLSSDR